MSETIHIANHGNWWTTSNDAFRKYGIFLGRLMKSMRSVQQKVFDREAFSKAKERKLPLKLLTGLREVSCPSSGKVVLNTTPPKIDNFGNKTEWVEIKDKDIDDSWDANVVFDINNKCYSNRKPASRHLSKHCPMTIKFLPPSKVPISSLLRENYIYDVRLDNKKGKTWTVICKKDNDSGLYVLKKLKHQNLRETTKLTRARSYSGSEIEEGDIQQDSEIDLHNIVQVRGPLIKDLAKGYEQKERFCDATKTIKTIQDGEEKFLDPNKIRLRFLKSFNVKRKVTAEEDGEDGMEEGEEEGEEEAGEETIPKSVLSVDDLDTDDVPYRTFVEKTTRITNKPRVRPDAIVEIEIINNNVKKKVTEDQGEQTAPFFELKHNGDIDYFCNLKIHDDGAVDTYVRAHDAPYDVTNFRIPEYEQFLKDKDEDEDDENRTELEEYRNHENALLTLQKYLDEFKDYKRYEVVYNDKRFTISGGSEIKICKTRLEFHTCRADAPCAHYAVYWSLNQSLVFDREMKTTVCVRSCIKSTKPICNDILKEFPQNYDVEKSDDTLHITSNQCSVKCRLFNDKTFWAKNVNDAITEHIDFQNLKTSHDAWYDYNDNNKCTKRNAANTPDIVYELFENRRRPVFKDVRIEKMIKNYKESDHHLDGNVVAWWRKLMVLIAMRPTTALHTISIDWSVFDNKEKKNEVNDNMRAAVLVAKETEELCRRAHQKRKNRREQKKDLRS